MNYLYYSALAPKANVYALTQLQGLARLIQSGNEAAIKAETDRLRSGLDKHFDSFFYDVDKEIFASSFISFYRNLPPELHPPLFASVVNPPKAVIETVMEEESPKKTPQKTRKSKRA